MSLQVWLPLNGNLENQGLSDMTFSYIDSNSTVENTGGKMGKCYYNNSYTAGGLVSNKAVMLGTKQSTFCWVKFNSFYQSSELTGLVTQHCYDSCTGMGITAKCVSNSSGYLSVNTGDGNGNRTYNTYCGSTLLNAGIWYHVGYTYDGQYIRLYVNGKLDNTHAYADIKAIDDFIGIGIWAFNNNNGEVHHNYKLDGSLNDIRIYDHCLSAKEVKEISKGLVIHYPLKQIDRMENLLLDSDVYVSNSDYCIRAYKYTDPKKIISGEVYTMVLKGNLASGKSYFSAYNYTGYRSIADLTDNGNGYYSSTFTMPSFGDGYYRKDNNLRIYTVSNSVTATSTIEWIKLVKGAFDYRDVAWTASRHEEVYYKEKISTGLSAGGNTSVSGNSVVIQHSNSVDTFFFVEIDRDWETGQKYILSFDCNADTCIEDGESFALCNLDSYVFKIHSGHNEFEFTVGNAGDFNNWGGKKLLVDDYNKPLTYNYTLSNVEVRLVHTTEYDCSGFNNNGTVVGSPTLVSTNKKARNNLGTYFKSSERLVSINPSFITNGTCSFWMKMMDNNEAAWSPFSGQTGAYYFMATESGGAFYHGGTNISGTIYVDGVSRNTPIYNDGNWHHYCVTGLNLSSWTALYLNYYALSYNRFNVDVCYSDIRFYATSLSEKDVKELYNAPISIAKNNTLMTQGSINNAAVNNVKFNKNGTINCTLAEINSNDNFKIFKKNITINNLVSDPFINETSNSYGFGWRGYFHIESGKTYTLTACGHIDNDYKASLRIYMYTDNWTYAYELIRIFSKEDVIQSGSFTATQTCDMVINSYSYLEPNGTESGGYYTTLKWIKLVEGKYDPFINTDENNEIRNPLICNNIIEY